MLSQGWDWLNADFVSGNHALNFHFFCFCQIHDSTTFSLPPSLSLCQSLSLSLSLSLSVSLSLCLCPALSLSNPSHGDTNFSLVEIVLENCFRIHGHWYPGHCWTPIAHRCHFSLSIGHCKCQRAVFVFSAHCVHSKQNRIDERGAKPAVLRQFERCILSSLFSQPTKSTKRNALAKWRLRHFSECCQLRTVLLKLPLLCCFSFGIHAKATKD